MRDGIANIGNVDGVIGEFVEDAGEDLRHMAIEAGDVLVMRVRRALCCNHSVAGAARVIARARLQLRVAMRFGVGRRMASQTGRAKDSIAA